MLAPSELIEPYIFQMVSAGTGMASGGMLGGYQHEGVHLAPDALRGG